MNLVLYQKLVKYIQLDATGLFGALQGQVEVATVVSQGSQSSPDLHLDVAVRPLAGRSHRKELKNMQKFAMMHEFFKKIMLTKIFGEYTSQSGTSIVVENPL